MPRTTIPLVGQQTRRGYRFAADASKDQFIRGALLRRVTDAASGSSIYYCEKAPGFLELESSGNGNASSLFFSTGLDTNVVAYGAANSVIEVGFPGTDVGTITGKVVSPMVEQLLNGLTYVMIASGDGTGWYLASDSYAATSYTGDTTNASPVITNIASTAGMYSGQAISGTGIPASTRILTVDSSTQITLNANATATNAGVTLTKTPIAKILSANFPTMVGSFACMDGFAFAADANGNIYNSDHNTVVTWLASSRIGANQLPDTIRTIVSYRQHIAVFGAATIEFLFNNGNSFGSVLLGRKELFTNVGCRWPGTLDGHQVCKVHDSVFWLSDDNYLHTFDGFTPKNLQKPGVGLGTEGVVLLAAVSAFQVDNDILVNITARNDTTTNPRSKLYSTANDTYYTSPYNSALVVNGSQLNSSYLGYLVLLNDDAIYAIDSETYTRGGSTLTLQVQTQPYVLNNGRPFTINAVELLADTQASGSTTLETCNDDYATFTTRGTFDLTATTKRVRRCGYYKNHAIFRVTDTGEQPWRAQAIVVDWEPAVT